jgi:phosphoglycerate dehydrogenase-like enzyme
MRVLAYEPHPDQEFCQQWRIDLVEMDDIFARSDIVSLHLPATRDTRHLINADTLARMRKGSILINTARGSLVDESALCDALRSGHLAGAGLDVFEVEPLSLDSPLLEFDNVLLAGHLAGLDQESHMDSFAMAARTIIALRDGEWPAFCIQNLRGVKDWKW